MIHGELLCGDGIIINDGDGTGDLTICNDTDGDDGKFVLIVWLNKDDDDDEEATTDDNDEADIADALLVNDNGGVLLRIGLWMDEICGGGGGGGGGGSDGDIKDIFSLLDVVLIGSVVFVVE